MLRTFRCAVSLQWPLGGRCVKQRRAVAPFSALGHSRQSRTCVHFLKCLAICFHLLPFWIVLRMCLAVMSCDKLAWLVLCARFVSAWLLWLLARVLWGELQVGSVLASTAAGPARGCEGRLRKAGPVQERRPHNRGRFRSPADLQAAVGGEASRLALQIISRPPAMCRLCPWEGGTASQLGEVGTT